MAKGCVSVCADVLGVCKAVTVMEGCVVKGCDCVSSSVCDGVLDVDAGVRTDCDCVSVREGVLNNDEVEVCTSVCEGVLGVCVGVVTSEWCVVGCVCVICKKLNACLSRMSLMDVCGECSGVMGCVGTCGIEQRASV